MILAPSAMAHSPFHASTRRHLLGALCGALVFSACAALPELPRRDATVVDASADASTEPPPEITGASPVMRRLSRADYLNSVRDLVGDFAVEARELPFDQLGYLKGAWFQPTNAGNSTHESPKA